MLTFYYSEKNEKTSIRFHGPCHRPCTHPAMVCSFKCCSYSRRNSNPLSYLNSVSTMMFPVGDAYSSVLNTKRNCGLSWREL